MNALMIRTSNFIIFILSKRIAKQVYNQSGAAANFDDRTYRQILGPNVKNNI